MVEIRRRLHAGSGAVLPSLLLALVICLAHGAAHVAGQQHLKQAHVVTGPAAKITAVAAGIASGKPSSTAAVHQVDAASPPQSGASAAGVAAAAPAATIKSAGRVSTGATHTTMTVQQAVANDPEAQNLSGEASKEAVILVDTQAQQGRTDTSGTSNGASNSDAAAVPDQMPEHGVGDAAAAGALLPAAAIPAKGAAKFVKLHKHKYNVVITNPYLGADQTGSDDINGDDWHNSGYSRAGASTSSTNGASSGEQMWTITHGGATHSDARDQASKQVYGQVSYHKSQSMGSAPATDESAAEEDANEDSTTSSSSSSRSSKSGKGANKHKDKADGSSSRHSRKHSTADSRSGSSSSSSSSSSDSDPSGAGRSSLWGEAGDDQHKADSEYKEGTAEASKVGVSKGPAVTAGRHTKRHKRQHSTRSGSSNAPGSATALKLKQPAYVSWTESQAVIQHKGRPAQYPKVGGNGGSEQDKGDGEGSSAEAAGSSVKKAGSGVVKGSATFQKLQKGYKSGKDPESYTSRGVEEEQGNDDGSDQALDGSGTDAESTDNGGSSHNVGRKGSATFQKTQKGSKGGQDPKSYSDQDGDENESDQSLDEDDDNGDAEGVGESSGDDGSSSRQPNHKGSALFQKMQKGYKSGQDPESYNDGEVGEDAADESADDEDGGSGGSGNGYEAGADADKDDEMGSDDEGDFTKSRTKQKRKHFDLKRVAGTNAGGESYEAEGKKRGKGVPKRAGKSHSEPRAGAGGQTGSIHQRIDVAELDAMDDTNPYRILMLLAWNEMTSCRNLSDPYGYWTLAGVHGLEWPYNGTKPGKKGFCVHASPSFAGWHRPYVWAFEQGLLQHAAKVVARLKTPQLRETYGSVLQTMRLPYWDFTSPQVPHVLRGKKVTVIDEDGEYITIRNPLAGFKYPKSPGKGTSGITSRGPKWVAGVRRGSRHWAKELASFVRSGDFACTYNGPARCPGNLEQIHNSIHSTLGSSEGELGKSEYAAFDPLFWLLHATVDRCIWLFQNNNHDGGGWVDPDTYHPFSPPGNPEHVGELGYTYRDPYAPIKQKRRLMAGSHSRAFIMSGRPDAGHFVGSAAAKAALQRAISQWTGGYNGYQWQIQFSNLRRYQQKQPANVFVLLKNMPGAPPLPTPSASRINPDDVRTRQDFCGSVEGFSDDFDASHAKRAVSASVDVTDCLQRAGIKTAVEPTDPADSLSAPRRPALQLSQVKLYALAPDGTDMTKTFDFGKTTVTWARPVKMRRSVVASTKPSGRLTVRSAGVEKSDNADADDAIYGQAVGDL